MSLTIRKAFDHDLDQVYMMGYDAWSDGGTEEDYLKGCRASPKYKKGTWFILFDGQQMLSSLIVYNLGENRFGIGSISTPVLKRNHGFASKLISAVITEIENEFQKVNFFLYSDIAPQFYEKFGFIEISRSGQRYEHTTCMVRGGDLLNFMEKLKTPEYF